MVRDGGFGSRLVIASVFATHTLDTACRGRLWVASSCIRYLLHSWTIFLWSRGGECNGSIISVTLLLILPYIHSFPYLIVATLFVRIYTQLGYLLSGLWLWASAHIHQKIIHPPNNTIGFGRFSSEGLSDSSTNLLYTSVINCKAQACR